MTTRQPIDSEELDALLRGERPLVTERLFEGTDLTAAELDAAVFERCDFVDVSFRRADLTDARFERCSFFRPEPAASCDFSFARLRDASFESCDLTTAAFVNVHAYGLRLTGCVAGGIDFSGADFSLGPGRVEELAHATLADCSMPWADFSGVTLARCTLTGCRLTEAIFNQANLAEAELAGSDITGIETQGLSLAGADLRGATFNNLDPRTMDLAGVRVTAEQALMLLAPLGIEVD